MRRISSWTCSQSTWWQTQTRRRKCLLLPPGALAFDHILKQTASFFFLATMANVVDLVSGHSLFVPDARQTVRLSELLSEADWEIRVFFQIVPWLLETSKSQCFSTLEVLDTRPRSLRSLHGAYRWRQNEAEQPVEEKKSTSVLPSCCKSRWHSPPKSYLVVLSALCCQNVFAVWKLDKRRWGGLTGTWHWKKGLERSCAFLRCFLPVRPPHSHVSEQVLQMPYQCTSLFYVYFTHVQQLKVRLLWLFSAVEARPCRALFASSFLFLVVSICRTFWVELFETSLELEKIDPFDPLFLQESKGVMHLNDAFDSCQKQDFGQCMLWDEHIIKETECKTHMAEKSSWQTRDALRCFKHIAMAGGGAWEDRSVWLVLFGDCTHLKWEIREMLWQEMLRSSFIRIHIIHCSSKSDQWGDPATISEFTAEGSSGNLEMWWNF